jgi:hypothetical protein
MLKGKINLLIFILIYSGRLIAQEASIEYSSYSDTVPVNFIQRGTADSVYKFITEELDFIDYNDCNNCDSRAHLISGIINNCFKVRTAKVWLFTNRKRSSQKEKYLSKPDRWLTYNDCLLWSWHAAPVIIIQNQNKYADTLVMDPSTEDGPVSIKEWASAITSAAGKGFVIIKDARYQRFPVDENGKFEDTKEIWQGESLLDTDWSRSIENILQPRYGILDPWTRRNYEMRIRKMLSDQ